MNSDGLARVSDFSPTSFSVPSALKRYFSDVDVGKSKFLDNLKMQVELKRPKNLKFYIGQVIEVTIGGVGVLGVISGWTSKCTQKYRWINGKMNVPNSRSTKTAENPFYTIILEKSKVDELCILKESKCDKLQFLNRMRDDNYSDLHKIWKYQVQDDLPS